MRDSAREFDVNIAVVERVLRAKDYQLVLAESCTGGLIAEQITNIPGASDWFYGSFVVYQASAKTEMLGIPGPALREHGLVSEYTALAMAKRSLARSSAHVSISVTGLAGPDGDGSSAHVGELWIGRGDRVDGEYAARHFELDAGERTQFRKRACELAIAELAAYLTTA